jgi:hypothetical protein
MTGRAWERPHRRGREQPSGPTVLADHRPRLGADERAHAEARAHGKVTRTGRNVRREELCKETAEQTRAGG